MRAAASLLQEVFKYLIVSLVELNTNWSAEQIGGRSDPSRKTPNIVFAESESRTWYSVTFDGESHRFQLELTCPESTDGVEAQRLGEEVIAVLEDVDLPLEDHILIDLQLEKILYEKLTRQRGYLARLFFHGVTVRD